MNLAEKTTNVQWARPFFPENKSAPAIILPNQYAIKVVWGRFDGQLDTDISKVRGNDNENGMRNW